MNRLTAEPSHTRRFVIPFTARGRATPCNCALGAFNQPLPDTDDNRQLYGQRPNSKEILMTPMTPPNSARPLIAELDRYPMHKQG